VPTTVTICGAPFVLETDFTESVNNEQFVAGLLYQKYLEKQDDWRQELARVVGVSGIIGQLALNTRMVVCAERAKEQAQEQFEFYRDNFNDLIKPMFECIKNEFTSFVETLKGCEIAFIERNKDYEASPINYDVHKGRVMGTVSAQFDRGQKERQRQVGKYASGRCKSENVRFQLAKRTALVDASHVAFRYAEARRIQDEERAFGRQRAALECVKAIGARVFGSVNQSGSVLVNGLNGLQGAFGGTLDAYGAVSSAASGLSDVFGSISNGAFSYAGYQSFGRPISPGGLGYQGYGGSTGYNTGFATTGYGQSGASGYQSTNGVASANILLNSNNQVIQGPANQLGLTFNANDGTFG